VNCCCDDSENGARDEESYPAARPGGAMEDGVASLGVLTWQPPRSG